MTEHIARVYLSHVSGPGTLTNKKYAYLGGPMRGYPAFNFPMFHEVAEILRRMRGLCVFNPAEHDEAAYPHIREWAGYATGDTGMCPEFDLKEALRWDLARVLESDVIVLLPGWEQSVGAQLEKQVAETIGLGVWAAETQGH